MKEYKPRVCTKCGKKFKPTSGYQKKCNTCKPKHKKNFRCPVFPNCEKCPYPDCIDNTSREFIKNKEEGEDEAN